MKRIIAIGLAVLLVLPMFPVEGDYFAYAREMQGEMPNQEIQAGDRKAASQEIEPKAEIDTGIFGGKSVLRINDDFENFLMASSVVSAFDFSHIEYVNIVPDFIIDGLGYMEAERLAAIADASFSYDFGNVTIANDLNGITINKEGRTNGDRSKKLVIEEGVFYVPIRIAQNLGLTIEMDWDTMSLNISKPYIPHTLLVTTDNINLDTYGADRAVVSTKYHCFLYYSSLEKAQFAYEKYTNRRDVKAVEFNAMLVPPDIIIEEAPTSGSRADNDIINGVYSGNQHVAQAINWNAGNENLDQIANIYGNRDDDVVAILDSGFYLEAPFANNPTIVNPWDVTGIPDSNVFAPNGNNAHGTFILGIVAQFSKGCNIMPVKIANDNGQSTTNDSVNGLNAVIVYNQQLNAQGKKVVAVNNSYGGSGNVNPNRQAKIDELYSAGVTVVTAAGNDNANARMLSPANSDHVITVGALNTFWYDPWGSDPGGVPDSSICPVWSATNYGETVEIYAPGRYFYGNTYDAGSGTAGFHWTSGTSNSAPVVTGIIMLMHKRLYNASKYNNSQHSNIIEVDSKSINAFLRGGDNSAVKWVRIGATPEPPAFTYYGDSYESFLYYLDLETLSKTSKVEACESVLYTDGTSELNYNYEHYLIPNDAGLPSADLGGEQNPFLISSSDNLDKLAKSVFYGLDLTGNYFKQTQDIEYSNNKFTPIGFRSSGVTYTNTSLRYKSADILSPFSGNYDGNNKSITFTEDMTFNKYYEEEDITSIPEYMGVFGWIKNGSVKNLSIKYNNRVSASTNYLGGFVGCLENGKIEKCSVINNNSQQSEQIRAMSTYTNSGGFAAHIKNGGQIFDSYSTASVSGYTEAMFLPNDAIQTLTPIKVAGFAIQNNGSINNCYAAGSVYDIKQGYGVYPETNAARFIVDCVWPTSGPTATPYPTPCVKNSYWIPKGAQSGILNGSNYTEGCGLLPESQQEFASSWDFYSTWKIEAGENNGYPFHRVEPIPYPTQTPTLPPTLMPTQVPTQTPTLSPTATPTQTPTQPPTMLATPTPTQPPTQIPTQPPTMPATSTPTQPPTQPPTIPPTITPTQTPTQMPTLMPTQLPTATPTDGPKLPIYPTITQTDGVYGQPLPSPIVSGNLGNGEVTLWYQRMHIYDPFPYDPNAEKSIVGGGDDPEWPIGETQLMSFSSNRVASQLTEVNANDISTACLPHFYPWTTQVPTAVGTYKIRAVIAETQYYYGATTPAVTFKIKNAAQIQIWNNGNQKVENSAGIQILESNSIFMDIARPLIDLTKNLLEVIDNRLFSR